jgi:hypothetical protein
MVEEYAVLHCKDAGKNTQSSAIARVQEENTDDRMGK